MLLDKLIKVAAVVSFVLGTGVAQAQGTYANSPEYKRMLEEIRTASPSPAYIATGLRPQGDPRLNVKVIAAATGSADLQVETNAARVGWNAQRSSLTMEDLHTKRSWQLVGSREGCGQLPVPAAQAGGTDVVQSGTNHWTWTTRSSCGSVAFDLEVLTDGLARLTLHVPQLAGGPVAEEAGRLHLHVSGGGPCFGLGERFWQAGLSNTVMNVRPQDRSGEPGHNWSYVAVPLVYTAAGLGLYADTAFDTQMQFDSTGTSFDMELSGQPVPLYLFAEPNPKAVLSAYTAITGRPQNPPQWTFGPWITALGGRGAVFNLARQIREEDIPASALWVYDQNDEQNNLGWPFWFASYYGEPRAFVDTLHGQGFKVLTYVHPYLRAEMMPFFSKSPQYEKGVASRFLVTGADGKPDGPRFEDNQTGNIDFTNPAAVDWWQAMITNAVQRDGFDGWMQDFGEWVRDSDHFAAGSGTTLAELYPLLYHKVTVQIAQALNPEVVPFERSGSAGSQHFAPVLWGGDQSADWSRDYGLPSVITAGITAGMSGYSTWGPDILSTGADRDLWKRWVEFGALTPVMRDHPWDKPVGSLNLFTDPATTQHFRRWAAFHSSLLPYLETYAQEASRTGVPIMRHTVLEFPDDPRSATAEYQYMLGREMLVAPVYQGGQTLRTLYLPRGEWVNFWNGNFYTGGQDATVDCAQIPILIRAGSVIPFKPEEEAGHWSWSDATLMDTSLVWRAYPTRSGEADSTFTLTNGTSAHLVQHGSTLLLEGTSKTARDYEIILRSKQTPSVVRLNGSELAPYTPGSRGQRASQWWWNPSTGELHIRFHGDMFHVEVEGITRVGYGS